MYNNLRVRAVIIVTLILTGCSSVRTADDWRTPEPYEMETSYHGSFIRIEGQLEVNKRFVAQGEFIAVNDSFVVISMPGEVRSIPLSAIKYAGIVVHNNAPWSHALGGLGMTLLSVAANGWFCVFTGTAALLTGIISATSEISRGQIETESNHGSVPVSWWYKYRKFARFPAGLPEGINLQDLKY